MSTKVIIGAGLGDEGKGKMVDYFANEKSFIIRYNGGAQAAHTVVTPDYNEHVFHHICSGAFKGATTLLSEFFIVNPLVFMEEYQDLQVEFDLSPTVYVSPRCLVSTPWDMEINQQLEKSRGVDRHGSCGLGINETIVRSEHDKYRLTVEDLKDMSKTHEIMYHIQNVYYEKRCKELGIPVNKDLIEDPDIAFGTYKLYEMFYAHVSIFEEVNQALFVNFDNVIFEGAQGLLLDEDHEWFPHVTRSKPGLDNVLVLAERYGLTDLEVIYVSRCYATRHGAGPLPRETVLPPYSNIADPSNPENEHQGVMRYGYLDLSLLERTIKNDLQKGNGQVKSARLALTCLDQVLEEEHHRFFVDDLDSMQELPESLFISIVQSRVGLPVIKTYGRSRNYVVE